MNMQRQRLSSGQQLWLPAFSSFLWRFGLLFLQWTLFDGEGFLDILLLFMARWVSSYVCSAFLRAHYRNSELMLGQMGQFTLESVDCLCCKRKHRKAECLNLCSL
ncbi:unnamed protein product [Durusdinium trenchii]|uniref:Uncharacterized protein n=1 Tax=Durusdinium trenchii TaxID=1381693 RepID=A0ABP0H652_9DINO